MVSGSGSERTSGAATALVLARCQLLASTAGLICPGRARAVRPVRVTGPSSAGMEWSFGDQSRPPDVGSRGSELPVGVLQSRLLATLQDRA
jgi:hypothetical protein